MLGGEGELRPIKEKRGKGKDDVVEPKLQALVYDILPSTAAVFSYAIGSRKLSANEQFFVELLFLRGVDPVACSCPVLGK